MRPSFQLMILTFSMLLALHGTALAGDTFLALTGPLPPLSVNKGLRVKGISVGVLIEIMDIAGVRFSPKNIKLVPWSVAYKETLEKPGVILLNAPRTGSDEAEFKWVGPVVTSRFGLIGKKDKPISLSSTKDATRYKVSSIRNSSLEKVLLSQGIDKESLQQSTTHVQALKQLKSGEVDLFAHSDLGAAYFMRNLGLKPRKYSMLYTYEEVSLYFAFNKSTEDTLIAKLNRALEKLKQPGPAGVSRFDEIVDQYLPNGRVE